MTVCKICLEKISPSFADSLFSSLHPLLCPSCLRKFHPIFLPFQIEGIQGMAIFSYDSWIQSLLHRYKELKDIELRHVFLELYARELRFQYRNYVLVPMPSSQEKEEQRGFSHLHEMFSCLHLPFLDLLEKKKNFKQEKAHRKERFENRFYLSLKRKMDLSSYSILLVDDVMSTGATMLRAVSLIQELHPKRLQILILSKNERKRR